ncbi:growth/differentiation factor 10-like [Conger conger]|uniref:growth/differentiation factor 10-like n=1 Tax=Conger conger TaxID=82655 RepID=UPI002A59CECE|nr:growth/differentiation factor 10-like [Conger conger]
MSVIFVFLLLVSLCLKSRLGTAASEDAIINGQDSGVFDAADGQTWDTSTTDRSVRDMVSIHMFKLYDKYNKELNRPRDGNTVRSLKASADIATQDFYRFNLTSITESEEILSATVHFFFNQRPLQHSWSCKRFRTSSCRHQHLQQLPPFYLIFRATSPNNSHGTLLGNITFFPHKRGTWQSKDISHIVKEARKMSEPIVRVKFSSLAGYQGHQDHISPSNLPYVLVFANDQAISEPNSVAATLQRYDPFPLGEAPTRSPNTFPDARVRRDTHVRDPVQDNELPEVDYRTLKNGELWERAYLPPKPKSSTKESQRRGSGEPQVLSFDEKTMKKARRRQWSEPRVCARRYLKVDFADVGWSEWIIAPKSFDAFYCSGTCGFPLPKILRPSNHATIQSIVKAVGITPGIPEPCCVPDKMSSQSVLFLDEAKNMVLKIYPNMSVQTCACR